MDGWNTFSFPFGAKGLFSGVNLLLVSGRVLPGEMIQNLTIIFFQMGGEKPPTRHGRFIGSSRERENMGSTKPESFRKIMDLECLPNVGDMLVLWRVSLFFNFQMAQNLNLDMFPLDYESNTD